MKNSPFLLGNVQVVADLMPLGLHERHVRFAHRTASGSKRWP